MIFVFMYHLSILNVEILEGKVLLWLDSARFVKNKSGAYVLYDKKLNVLYIGQSDSLQKEFEKYVDTDFENDECKQKPILIKDYLLKIQKNE